MRLLPLLVLALPGCQILGGQGLGGGPEMDARFIADIYTWQCESGEEQYEGVFAFDLSLEYAPDALAPRTLPGAGGCAYGLSMFGMDTNSVGVDIPDLADNPGWETITMTGELKREGEGFYYDDVFENEHTCHRAGELLEGGSELQDAGALSGVITPEPGDLADVTLTGTMDQEAGFPWGEDIQIRWEASGWDQAWVQVRRERDGEAWETVTCNATGLDSFTIGDDVWGLLSEDLPVTTNNVYVGFQAKDEVPTGDGQRVEVYTRAMHVAVVQGS